MLVHVVLFTTWSRNDISAFVNVVSCLSVVWAMD